MLKFLFKNIIGYSRKEIEQIIYENFIFINFIVIYLC